jgi:glutamate N-acetyltransferase/amino-acid N-acetyltransferase
MEPLPVERVTAGLAQAVADFGAANWASAAEAIMTTDTVAKAASRKVRLSSRRSSRDRNCQGRGDDSAGHGDDAGVRGDRCEGRTKHPGADHEASGGSLVQCNHGGWRHFHERLVRMSGDRPGPVARSDKDIKAMSLAITEVAQQLAQAIIRDAKARPSS